MSKDCIEQQDHEEKQGKTLPPLMEAREMAELLGVSGRTVARLATEGKIPGTVKVGKLWRFNRQKVYDFLGLEA